jgi:hypothetical protein
MKTTPPCFSVVSATGVRLVVGAILAAPLTMIAPTEGAARTTTAQEWSTEVDGKTVTLRAPVETEAGDVVVLRDGAVSYRHQIRGGMGDVVGWRDVTGDGTPEIQFSVLTSRSTSQSIVLEATPRKIHELVSLSGRFGSGLSLDSLSPSSGLRVVAYDLPGLTEKDIKAQETEDGYASCIVPDGGYSGTELVLRDGAVVYRQPLMGPLPMAYQGQREDRTHCYPIEDLTGNGHGNVHIQDMTSRSTTLHVILDLGPDGVSELFNDTLHFSEHLVWEDTDGDGVLEPIVSGREGLEHLTPSRPGFRPMEDQQEPVGRGIPGLR